MKRQGHVLALCGVALLSATLGAAGAGAIEVRRTFPQTSGTLGVPGLRAPVEIVRDRWGIPHVYAQDAADLFFAQGYVHAQDRLWQMDLGRRAASGRLSEVFGPATLFLDRLWRTLGARRVAEEELSCLDPETVEALRAYAAGVNAFIATHAGRLPIEFLLLRYRPEPWTPVDSLVLGKQFAWSLGGTWRYQVLRDLLIRRFGVEETRVLMPPYPADAPIVVPRDSTDTAATTALRSLLDIPAPPPGTGSNNWAVSGSRTAGGRPLLANDPHLAAQMPSVWYEMHLVGGPYDVAGATLPGSPGVVIGHNDRIAWGVTNAGPDVQDLYVEQFDPADPTRYRVNGGWAPATVVHERIRVRGRQPVAQTVRITRHGPILSDAIGGFGSPVALRWTALDPGTVAASVLRIDRARTWGEFREALRLWTVPAQNFVYADRQGNIGYQLAGRIPIRSDGDALLPVDGWTGRDEWVGDIPFDRLPSALNPPSGYVATANNRIVADTYPYHIASEWDPGYRARRIETLLAATPRATVEDMRRIQMDLVSIPAQETIRALDGVRVSSGPEEALLDELRAWDGVLRPGSRAAAVYEAFRTALVPLVFEHTLGPDLYGRYLEQSAIWQPALIRLLATPTSSWWKPRGRDAVVAAALARARETLTRRLGPDPAGWSWGRLHTMRFVHPLGQTPLLAWLLDADAPPTGGDLFTVNNGGFVLDTFAQVVVASYRQIIDVGDWDRSLAIHTTGQSGLPLHPHYRDFVRRWAMGRYHPMLFSRARVEQEAAATLRLVPR
jgi:penicillin amidase